MDIPGLRRALRRWFARERRPLPWRQTRDPYALWISEVMLQQTTVGAVIPYYERFLRRFPTVRDLAEASEDSVLTEWAGLGYYSRARNLWRAAQTLVRDHSGVFPRDVEGAMALPGIGRYTASAITSLAYGTRAAVVDGNVHRVLSRLWATAGLSQARAQALAGDLLPTRAPGSWNEAVMELGATVCLPRKPRCGSCPVAPHCRGRSRPEHWSALKPRPLGVKVVVEMALVERDDEVLLVRDPGEALLGSLYELPHGSLPRRGLPAVGLRTRYRGLLNVAARPVATVRHSVTHHRIQADLYRARLVKKPAGDVLFQPRSDLLGLPLGGLTRKALRAVGLLAG